MAANVAGTDQQDPGADLPRALWDLIGELRDLRHVIRDGVRIMGVNRTSARKAARSLYGRAFTSRDIRAPLQRVAEGDVKSADLETIARRFERTADRIEGKIIALGRYTGPLGESSPNDSAAESTTEQSADDSSKAGRLLETIISKNTGRSSISQDIYALIAYRMARFRNKSKEKVTAKNVLGKVANVTAQLSTLDDMLFTPSKKPSSTKMGRQKKAGKRTVEKKGKARKSARKRTAKNPIKIPIGVWK